MKITALSVTLFLALSGSLNAQISNWNNHTDMKNVRSAALSSDGIWAATTGGAFVYNIQGSEYKTYHKVDGFSGSSLTSAAVDTKGRIWFGSSTGTIDIVDPVSNSVMPILDIYNSAIQQKGINDFIISGDSILIATDFGISVINANDLLFIDTYSHFGSLSSNIKVKSIYKGSLIYAGLENAMAVQKPGAPNLSSPEAWNVYPVIYNGTNRKINYITGFNDSILAATEYGIFIFNGSSFIPYINELLSVNISRMNVFNGVLYISSGTKLFSYNGQLTEVINLEKNITDITLSSAGLYLSTEDGILEINNGQVSLQIKPNAPYTNLFSSLTVDSDGSLWSASGRDVTGRGFYKLQNDKWTNYNFAGYPAIRTDAYYNAYSIGDEVYLGSWGTGFLKIKNGEFYQFNAANTPMEGISENPDFLVIGGLSKDSRNNLWVLNYGSVTAEYLSLLTPDSTWYNFKVPAMQNQYTTENFGLVVDQQDTKWFFSKSSNRPGLFYFNENNTYNTTGDDKSGYITEGLNSGILSLAVDKRGDIWIGTGLGVNVITNASSALSSNAQFRITSIFSLRQQSINCIAVDALNQKWIGTNQGLLLVNSDGSALLESYNVRNSPLLADEIRSLVVDEKTGIVYAGTDAGLTSFETSAKKPVETFGELSVYPNPLVLGKGKVLVTVDGLVKDSEIKIISISGKVINQFSSPGGRVAYWDGKTIDGEYVNSGIYYIVASDNEGNNVKSAKIAVLRE